MNDAGQKATSRSTRATLLLRLKDAEDHDSWREFFEAYWGVIYRTAIYAGCSASEAEDIVQETVIKLTKDLPRFNYDRDRGSFKAWLLGRVWWQIQSHQRKQRRRERYLADQAGAAFDELAGELPDESKPTLEAFWETEWQQGLVDVAVERVKQRVGPRTYQLFDLAVHHGLRPKEIAKRMQVSAVQVYLAKHRVTKMLTAEVRQLQEGQCD